MDNQKRLTPDEAKLIADYLRVQFPWLEAGPDSEDEGVSGADTVELLSDVYRSLKAVERG